MSNSSSVFSLGQRRQALLVVLVRLGFVIHGDAVGGEEARLDQGLAVGAEGVLAAGAQFGGDGVEHRRIHLAGDGTLPDQVVQLGLVRGEVTADLLGRARGGGGAHRFMRFLRVLRLGLELARFFRQRLGAVAALDDFADLGEGVLR